MIKKYMSKVIPRPKPIQPTFFTMASGKQIPIADKDYQVKVTDKSKKEVRAQLQKPLPPDMLIDESEDKTSA